MYVQEESHPFMNIFNVCTVITGGIFVMVSFGLFGDSDTALAGFLILVCGALLIWGAIWLAKVSNSFKQWARLTDGQKLRGYLILLPGLAFGIAVIVGLAALKVELGRKNN